MSMCATTHLFSENAIVQASILPVEKVPAGNQGKTEFNIQQSELVDCNLPANKDRKEMLTQGQDVQGTACGWNSVFYFQTGVIVFSLLQGPKILFGKLAVGSWPESPAKGNSDFNSKIS